MNDVFAILGFVGFTIVVYLIALKNHKNKATEAERRKRQYEIKTQLISPQKIEFKISYDEKYQKEKPPILPTNNAAESLSKSATAVILPSEHGELFAPQVDAWDKPKGVFESSTPFDRSIVFNYTDGNGKKSRRIVKCKEMQNYFGDQLAIYGQCQLRQAGRTFRIDRMSDVIDAETGEVIDDLPIFVDTLWKSSALYAFRAWCEGNTLVVGTFLYFLCANKNPNKNENEYAHRKFLELSKIYNLRSDDWRLIYDFDFPDTATGLQRHIGKVLREDKNNIEIHLEIARELTGLRKKPNFADLGALNLVEKKLHLNGD
jgi:hypothetical protein